MPLGTAQENSAGLPFKAAQPVGAKFSLKSLHVNLSLLQSGGFGGVGGLSVYRGRGGGGGFRPLVLGCPGTHSHVCGESLRSFC